MKVSILISGMIVFSLVSVCCSKLICQDVFYQADLNVDFSDWEEGFLGFAGNKRIKLKFGKGGHIFAVLHNETNKPIKVNSISIDGVEFEQAYKEGKIVWWKVRPNPVQANGYSEVIIRFRKKPVGDVNITFNTSAGVEEFKLKAKQIRYFWQSIVWDREKSKLILYLSASIADLKIADLLIDGLSVSSDTKWFKIKGLNGRNFFIAEVDLKNNWEQGQLHRIGLKFSGGATHTRFYRAVNGEFIHFSYGYEPKPYPGSNETDYTRFGVTMHINFHRYNKKSLDKLNRYGMRAIFSGGPEELKELDGHPACYGVYLMDEPDCRDYSKKEFPHELRIGYYGREIIPLENQFTITCPRTLVYLTIDNTYKPMNWYVYGQIGDIVSTDPYCLGIGKQPKWAVRAITQAFYGSAPKPLWAIIDAFYPPKKTKKKFPRFPSPEELRQTAYYCLASGARGLGYYINCTDNTFTGWNDNPLLQNEIKQISKELKIIGPYLAKGTPVPLVQTTSNSIFTRSILSHNSIVVIVVNHQMHSENLGPVIPRIPPETKIKVKIPLWWNCKRVNATFVGPGINDYHQVYKMVSTFCTIPIRYNFHVAGAILLRPDIRED